MTKIKIGGVYYKIVLTDPEDLNDDNGECNQQTQIIKINREASGVMRDKVLWHEIVHAWNICWSEELVEAIATMITTVINDNNLYKNTNLCEMYKSPGLKKKKKN